MARFVFASSLIFLVPLAAPALAQEICVENASETEWVFVADADGGARQVARLDPGGALCAEGQGAGTIAVFAALEDVEGCSRRVAPGSVTRMMAFPNVDLCRWVAAD